MKSRLIIENLENLQDLSDKDMTLTQGGMTVEASETQSVDLRIAYPWPIKPVVPGPKPPSGPYPLPQPHPLPVPCYHGGYQPKPGPGGYSVIPWCAVIL